MLVAIELVTGHHLASATSGALQLVTAVSFVVIDRVGEGFQRG